MTRRDMAAVLGSVAGVATVRAQEPPPNQPENLNTEAMEQLRKNSKALSKLELPMSAEPAFQFKA